MEAQVEQILVLARLSEARQVGTERLEAEYDGIEQALEWSLAHDPERGLELAARLRSFWSATGRFAVGRAWIGKLLTATSNRPANPLRARALSIDSMLAFRQGDNEEARQLAERALAVARQIDDPACVVDALIGLCRAGLRDQNVALVRRLSTEARTIAQKAGVRALETLPLHCLAEATRMSGDYAGARRLYNESIALNRELDDQHMITVEMNNLASVELHENNLHDAVRLWQESVRRAHADRDLYLLPYCVMGLGEVAAAAGSYERAARLLGAATGIFESTHQQIDPADRSVYERSVAATRHDLGPSFQPLWDTGRSLSIDDAVGVALTAEEHPTTGLAAEIAAMDEALWQAAKDGRLDDFRALLADEYQAIYGRGFVSADEDIAGTSKMQIRSFLLEHMRVRELAAGVALSTYVTVLDASALGDRDISGDYCGASVWQKFGGRWQLVYHSETRVPPSSA